MKIAFHGSFGGEIHPDQRDLNQSESSKIVLNKIANFIKKRFPGIEYENGPAVLESCIYTVTECFKSALTLFWIDIQEIVI